jgi:hypothetical protein
LDLSKRRVEQTALHYYGDEIKVKISTKYSRHRGYEKLQILVGKHEAQMPLEKPRNKWVKILKR